ncbi:MAG: hypothetical protein EA409_07390 [Saprospirales bacterium]|nr:MAG: hypothetical protein EA409_07390 [Saprospirales bacterium]
MIPKTFEEWKNCIVYDCKINLNRSFAQKRIAVYRDKNQAETKKFILLYGENHLNNIIQWLKQIR